MMMMMRRRRSRSIFHLQKCPEVCLGVCLEVLLRCPRFQLWLSHRPPLPWIWVMSDTSDIIRYQYCSVDVVTYQYRVSEVIRATDGL